MKTSEKLKNLLSVLSMSDFDRKTINEAVDLALSAEYQKERETKEAENLKSAHDQALAQMSSISEMVAALECDYHRLQELRDERDDLNLAISSSDQDSSERELLKADFREWENVNSEELEDLENAAGDCENEDEARERIQEDALDIQVRSDWCHPGETEDPSEFMILLCTGGPAVRIVGELSQGEPCRAWIEYQDWFTPWAELVDGVSHSDLLTYCRQFYFGE